MDDSHDLVGIIDAAFDQSGTNCPFCRDPSSR